MRMNYNVVKYKHFIIFNERMTLLVSTFQTDDKSCFTGKLCGSNKHCHSKTRFHNIYVLTVFLMLSRLEKVYIKSICI